MLIMWFYIEVNTWIVTVPLEVNTSKQKEYNQTTTKKAKWQVSIALTLMIVCTLRNGTHITA